MSVAHKVSFLSAVSNGPVVGVIFGQGPTVGCLGWTTWQLSLVVWILSIHPQPMSSQELEANPDLGDKRQAYT